jgi:SnoaL-like domain
MKEISERQVPNLEAMDEQQAHRFLTELYTVLSAEKEYELRHEDFVMEMPQSGERVRGRENMLGFQRALAEHFPRIPKIRIDRVRISNGLWVKERVNDYGDGVTSNSVVIYELKDGKIWRDLRYYSQPFEAPDWRAQWVERM